MLGIENDPKIGTDKLWKRGRVEGYKLSEEPDRAPEKDAREGEVTKRYEKEHTIFIADHERNRDDHIKKLHGIDSRVLRVSDEDGETEEESETQWSPVMDDALQEMKNVVWENQDDLSKSRDRAVSTKRTYEEFMERNELGDADEKALERKIKKPLGNAVAVLIIMVVGEAVLNAGAFLASGGVDTGIEAEWFYPD